MKKSLSAILIVVVLLGALVVCCNFNGQLAYAEVEFTELDNGISWLVDDRNVYLYTVADNGKPVGVRLRGYYFGQASGIEVVADVYSCNALTIDFKINEKAANLTATQIATRNTLIDFFTAVHQMITEVDNVANTTYDGANGGVTSDVYRYNTAKQGDVIEVSRYTYEMLTYAREMYTATKGAFNPAVYRLVDLWGFSSRIYSNGNFGLSYDRHVTAEQFFNNGYPLPEQKYVEAFSNSAFTDFSQNAVQLSESNGSYYVAKNVAPAVVDGEKFEQWIDLGGIAKGYAVDVTRAMIKELGVDRFYVDAGTSSIATGNEWNGGNTSLGMSDSFDKASAYFPTPLFSVEIGKSSVSTSGQNVRKYTVDGVEYAHIIDGVTGAPAQTGVRSVMVVVPEEVGAFWATMGDCLTTALTVIGRDRIVEFTNGFLKENGIKIVVQYETLDGRKQLLSNFNQDDLTPIAESYPEYGWAMKLDENGNFYYDANAKFANPKGVYTVLIAVLGSLLGAGVIALVVYHFLKGKNRTVTNVVNAKKDKPFKALDVFAYVCVALLIVVLFAVFVFDTNNTQLQIVTVIDDETGETLLVYNVTRNEYTINSDNSNGWQIVVETVDGDAQVTLSRQIAGERHFNTLVITRGQEPSVQMVDSLCGYHQDCVHNFPAISRSGGAIVCSPNRLKVVTA